MKFWPRLRESLFTLWHKTLDYDRKIPAAKRQQTQIERDAAKRARLSRDRQMAIHAQTAKYKKATEVEVVPPIIPKQPLERFRPSDQALQQQPQIIYIQQPAQKVVVKSSGCADGCAIIIAVVLIIVFLPIGCSLLGLGVAGKAIKDEVDRQDLEKARRETIQNEMNPSQGKESH